MSSTSPPLRGPVPALLLEMRSFLEARWRDWKAVHPEAVQDPVSDGMCRFTAAFAALVLPEDIGGRWIVRGGAPDPAPDLAGSLAPGIGGICDIGGVWRSHFWTRGVVYGAPMLVDLTADQFGHAAVILAADTDCRYCANYRAQALHTQLRGVADRAAEWAALWRARRPPPAR